MVLASNLGFPRIGAHRELKKALESYWKGETNAETLLGQASTIRRANWELQKKVGIDLIPSNDFSLYDQILDMVAMTGATPERFHPSDNAPINLRTYFAMARGSQDKTLDVPAMEMTKYFDTNYHYLVPEFHKDQQFSLSSTKAMDEFNEANSLSIQTKPVIIGPVSFLLLGKMKEEGHHPLELLDRLLPVYDRIISTLASLGAKWIQVDEPFLAMDLPENAKAAFKKAYTRLGGVVAKDLGINLILTTYFNGLRDNAQLAASLPIQALHIDLVRDPGQLNNILPLLSKDTCLSVGIVDGRNIWRNNLDNSLALIKTAINSVGSDRLIIAPSCSLLHSPVDLRLEEKLDDEIKHWMAFATQKLDEIVALARLAKNEGDSWANDLLAQSRKAVSSRASSPRIHNQEVKKRLQAVDASMLSRKSPYKERAKRQSQAIPLPLLPTTSIGSFPQTADIRSARAKFRRGELTEAVYNEFLKQKTKETVHIQEELDLDVLVHGEFERNDMVEYFGEQLQGFTFTEYGWVQSYGSRCVKPPVIYGDVWRKQPMTVDWITYAQSQTQRPMKGMLTGPVTILQWSFVRDDQPRSETCKQIGLAIRDEVADLEKAGITIIQIDEAALREGLPLRKSDWPAYLRWAVDAFRLSSCTVEDTTQIHTHMCYSEFNDIIAAVAEMDADVISIETSRSQMELLDAFVGFKYPNEIGPGVYDIHSPRIPTEADIIALLRKALSVLSANQIWVNPDCGLKTRGWAEVKPALAAMVSATKKLRAELGTKNTGKQANG